MLTLDMVVSGEDSADIEHGGVHGDYADIGHGGVLGGPR